MDRPMPGLAFNMMSLMFRVRDLVAPRERFLREAGIEPGHWVLDYGCGPGSYVIPAAEMVGETGVVHALDIHPLAVKRVGEMASRKGLTNVKTIRSDCDTGLPDGSVDVVLLYDIFHMLNDPHSILAELHRVLKPDGILSFSDPHMQEGAIVSDVTDGQLFHLSEKGERTFTFRKQQAKTTSATPNQPEYAVQAT